VELGQVQLLAVGPPPDCPSVAALRSLSLVSADRNWRGVISGHPTEDLLGVPGLGLRQKRQEIDQYRHGLLVFAIEERQGKSQTDRWIGIVVEQSTGRRGRLMALRS